MNLLLRLGIVGHTNTGKTSLIRTLLRNSRFGDVRDEAGTTRHVESARLSIDSESGIELRDTPGFEDSGALAIHIRELQSRGCTGKDCLQQCVASEASLPAFSQEIKVLKQALDCQLLLYVIDCREPVLEKYLDELFILQLAAIPILPVLNFIHEDAETLENWTAALAQRSLHAYVAFDTVAYTFDAEKRLYQKLQTLLESQYSLLQRLLAKREQDWNTLMTNCCYCVAELLQQACATEVTDGQRDSKQARDTLEATLRDLEQHTLSRILAIMQFEPSDIAMSRLPVSNGQWQLDLFSVETLKWLGKDTASAAATGAALGAGVDLAFGGLSLGAAAVAGAALGAVWQTGKRFGKSFYRRASGATSLRVDDLTLDLLLLRQWWLLETVFHRGHAATQTTELSRDPQKKLPEDWPHWRSRMRNCAMGIGADKTAVVEQTGNWIKDRLVNPAMR